MSIRIKSFLSYAVIVVLALVCTVLVIQNYTEQMFYETITEGHRRELALITNSLQQQLEHTADYEMSIALDSEIIETLKKYPNVTRVSADYNNVLRIIGAKINSIIGLTKSISSCEIITLNNEFLHISGSERLKQIEKAIGTQYFAKTNRKRSIVLKGPFQYSDSDEKRQSFFVLSKQIVDLMSLRAVGYVAIFIDEASIADLFQKNMPQETQVEYFLLDEGNRILSAAQKETIGETFGAVQGLLDGEVEILLESGTYLKGSGKDSVYYTMTCIEQNGWRVAYATPVQNLMAGQYYARLVVLLIGAVACFLSLLLSGILIHRMTRPILQLAEKMRTYYSTDKRKKMDFSSGNEIRNLYTGFEEMVQDTQNLMQQIYNEQEEKSNYKFQLIQSQIKPHFLYNTLETIKSLVDIGMNDVAGEAIVAISKFYRMSLNDGNDITSVEKEIELARQYLYIQKLRYMEYLDYTIESLEGLEQYMIPKLTLQPLLENAIYHGIKPKQEMGRISLTVKESKDTLTFVILDNGVGMPEEKRKRLMESLDTEEKQESVSFGLYSINRRIQLFFGPEYRLNTVSEEGIFTEVTVTIPKKS